MMTLAAYLERQHPRGPGGEWAHTPGGGGRRTGLAAWTGEEAAAIGRLAPGNKTQTGTRAPSDQALARIAQVQGFDAPARRGDLDAAVAAGGTRIYRGVPDPAQAADFLGDKPPRQGFGMIGNGTYFSPDPAVAGGYSTEPLAGDKPKASTVIEAVLPADAKVISFGDLMTKYAASLPELTGDHKEAFGDLGRWAAANGYDAIDARGLPGVESQFVVLNRGALVVAPERRTDLGAWTEEELSRFDALVSTDETKDVGDPALAAICEAQGFNGLPRRGDVDAEVAAGGRHLWRGIHGPRYADEETTATLRKEWAGAYVNRREGRHLGLGLWANGDYFAGVEATARNYAGAADGVIEAALPAGAKVIDSSRMESVWDALDSSNPGHAVLADMGRTAALLGYDAITMSSSPDASVVVLNRSALVVAP